jgi:hypothetical protein
MRLIQSISAILFILLLSSPASARRHNSYSDVNMEIISDQRGGLRNYRVHSSRGDVEKSYVIAKNDERYRIRVSNRGNRRVGIVIAVDGRNIISGKKSHLKFSERMYILGPHQTQEFEGWRTGRNRTNRFYFTHMENSYAADWGDYSAMGVVALSVFQEREQQVNRPGKSKGMHRAPGTGFGEQSWSPSREVHFMAENRATSKKFIKYEYRSTLCKKGIIQCRPKHRQNRFWSDNDRNGGYAPFPSWNFNLTFR